MNGFHRLLLDLFTGWEFLAAFMRLVSMLHVYLYKAIILAKNTCDFTNHSYHLLNKKHGELFHYSTEKFVIFKRPDSQIYISL